MEDESARLQMLCGASGAGYEFEAFPLGALLESGPFIYVIARARPAGNNCSWFALYVGQTCTLPPMLNRHPRCVDFRELRATHVALRKEPDERKRHLIVADLVFGLAPPLNARVPDDDAFDPEDDG